MPDTDLSPDVPNLVALREKRDRLRMTVIAYENTDRLGHDGLEELTAYRRELREVDAQIDEALK